MPDPTKRTDDPFADLFGKLPDPRMSGGDAPGPRRTPSPPIDDDALGDDVFTPQARPAAPRSAAPVTASTAGAAPIAAAAPASASVPPPPSAAAPASGPVIVSTGAVPMSRRAARAALEAQTGPSAQLPPVAPAATAAPAQTTPTAPREESLDATAVLPVTPPVDVRADAAEQQPASAPQFADLLRAEPVLPAATSLLGDAPAGRSSDSRVGDAEVAPAGGSLEDLFMGNTSSDDIGSPPPPRNKRRRRIGGWIAFGIVLLFIGGIAAGGLWVWNTYEEQIREVMGWEEPKDYAEGLANGEALVTISSGDTGSVISQSLYDAGVTKTPEAFYDMLVDTARNPTFYPGVYKLQKQMTSDAALAALQDPANKLENSALLREGLTVEQSLPILAEGIGIPLEDFQAAVADPSVYGVPATTLEGWLFPAMYTFDPGATAGDVIQTMVDRTVQSLDTAGVPAEDRQRVLTIASIIQREARLPDDFAKVSRVIQNRLDQGMQLQMDSTAQYGFGEMHDGTVSSSGEALADDNAWNTYVIPGLPVGPIANPGDVAIDAAMHPAEGPWLFFVTWNMDTGETIFTSTDAEHEQAKEKWFQWCEENDNRGC